MLGTDDLGDVLEEVEDLSANWRTLCVKLHLRESGLDVIEQDNPKDCQACLYKGLGEWLKLNYDYQRHGRPSWRRLAEAVWSLDKAMFEKIAKKHTHTGESVSYAITSMRYRIRPNCVISCLLTYHIQCATVIGRKRTFN